MASIDDLIKDRTIHRLISDLTIRFWKRSEATPRPELYKNLAGTSGSIGDLHSNSLVIEVVAKALLGSPLIDVNAIEGDMSWSKSRSARRLSGEEIVAILQEFQITAVCGHEPEPPNSSQADSENA